MEFFDIRNGRCLIMFENYIGKWKPNNCPLEYLKFT